MRSLKALALNLLIAFVTWRIGANTNSTERLLKLGEWAKTKRFRLRRN